ncbi:NADPH oxidase 5 [Plakobranchus ocellatus]|uniref:NADPH oxidase 5 n=1 Tax=Plakobranchus ocellatus TaxID=259542 RepID=A0AAV3Z906_9GAST|nr:NADPH oxidase 5 [Plakobranchus ocellatus]
MNLKKVDFVWVNRDQSNFEWFSSLLCNLEKEQSREASLKDAIHMHMFMTAAPNQYEVNGVGVQMALDLVHNAKKTDLLTGLATRTQGGRPDFDKASARPGCRCMGSNQELKQSLQICERLRYSLCHQHVDRYSGAVQSSVWIGNQTQQLLRIIQRTIDYACSRP